MEITKPPNWGNDTLSTFMDDLQSNLFATFHNRPDWFKKLADINNVFQLISTNLENPENVLTAAFVPRCHASYLGSTTMAAAAQNSEVYPLLRACLEYAGYAVITAFNDISLSKLFMSRHENSGNAKQIAREFSVKSMRDAIASKDERLSSKFSELYEACIDLGAHPNIQAISSNARIVTDDEEKIFQHYYFSISEPSFTNALILTARVGLTSLLVFQYIYPERFQSLGLTDELGRLCTTKPAV